MSFISKAEALALLDRCATSIDSPSNPHNPFSTTAWWKNFMEQALPADAPVFVLRCTGGGTSLMFLVPDEGSTGGLRSLSNFYTSLFAPLLSDASDRQAALATLVRDLSRALPRVPTTIIEPLDADAADTRALVAEFKKQGWYVRRFHRFGNWMLACGGMTFEQYLASRDSQLRNTIQRKSRKLLASGSLEIVVDPASVDAAMDAYEAIYLKSWKRPEPYPGFARGWARECARRGWLRLGVARVDGLPIAAQIWYVYDSCAYIFKLAYDEEHSKWSAGTVLTAELMRHVLEVDRVTEVDFGSGDDAYKKTWMSERRDRIGLVACNLRTVRGMFAALREMIGQARARYLMRRA